jgi:DNA-directed RNA polymerase subunit RPC12/RpoP
MTTVKCSRCGFKISIPARNWADHLSDAGWIALNWEGKTLCRECSERNT